MSGDVDELFTSLSLHGPPGGGQDVGSRVASINMALLTEGGDVSSPRL